MENERYPITLRDSAGRLRRAEVVLAEMDDRCRITLTYDGLELSAEADDYFAAFAEVRGALGREGVLPLCYGASRNVFPSAMSRSMGGGLAAYRLTTGKQALHSDLVFLFDTGPDVEPVLPEEQDAFFRSWLRSLGGRQP